MIRSVIKKIALNSNINKILINEIQFRTQNDFFKFHHRRKI